MAQPYESNSNPMGLHDDDDDDDDMMMGRRDVPSGASRMLDQGAGGGHGGGGGGLDGGDTHNSLGGGDIDGERAQDLMRLRALCNAARENDAESWEAIRDWLRTHDEEDTRIAVERIGEFQTTALHLACSNHPPVDVVAFLLNAAPHIVQLADSFGRVPLHYACAMGASEEVLRTLVEASPQSITDTENRGRTAVHFALANTERPATPSIVKLLSNEDVVVSPDKNGMLPLHYAGAWGASEEVLEVLTHINQDTIVGKDSKGRQPLHLALGNADRPASLTVVRFLLKRNREVVNFNDNDQQLPLHYLANRANALQAEQKQGRENAEKCLELYLNAEPIPTPDFLTALQSLPDWLNDRAVVTPIVQELLNHKIAQRFPTAVILLTFDFLVFAAISHWVSVLESIELRDNSDDTEERKVGLKILSLLYLSAAFFTLREFVQIASLWGLGLFQTWLYDPTNWIDVTFVVLITVWAVLMQTGEGSDDFFRIGAAVTLVVLYLKFLGFLKSLFIDFAVFVEGLYYVVQRLAAFLSVLVIILIAFAQMFYTVFRQTQYCVREFDFDDPHEPTEFVHNNMTELKENIFEIDDTDTQILLHNLTDLLDDVLAYEQQPFCHVWSSFLKVFTMLLGEVDEVYFRHSKFARWLFVLFMFLVVVLLANLLIAIVTDSYGVIKNERAAIVFWSNRLDFVAEMDAISWGWRSWRYKMSKYLCSCMGYPPDPESNGETKTVEDLQGEGPADSSLRYGGSRDTSFELWKRLVDLFEDDLQGIGALEWLCYMILRGVIGFVVIPFWLLLGLFSAGLLWPPQVREGLFIQRVQKGRNPEDMLKEPEQRQKQIKALREDVRHFQEDLVTEITADRREVLALKRQVARHKAEVQTEMKEIKDIVMMLYELQASAEE